MIFPFKYFILLNLIIGRYRQECIDSEKIINLLPFTLNQLKNYVCRLEYLNCSYVVLWLLKKEFGVLMLALIGNPAVLQHFTHPYKYTCRGFQTVPHSENKISSSWLPSHTAQKLMMTIRLVTFWTHFYPVIALTSPSTSFIFLWPHCRPCSPSEASSMFPSQGLHTCSILCSEIFFPQLSAWPVLSLHVFQQNSASQ